MGSTTALTRQYHRNLCKLLARSDICTTPMVIPQCSGSPAELSSLQPIELTDIMLGLEERNNILLGLQECNDKQGVELTKCHTGRAIYGTLCSDATRVGITVLTVLDAGKGTACVVHVLNAVQTSLVDKQVRALFPAGVRVAIKEPTISVVAENSTTAYAVLLLPHPGFLEIIGLKRTRFLMSLSPGELRTQGNLMFTQESYLLAAVYYSECMERQPIAPSEYVAACSSRAEAWLMLGKYEDAILDANRALEKDPRHTKSLYVKGRTLSSIQEHQGALECFKLALDCSGSKEMEAEFRKCRTLLDQSTTGEYNISEYLLSGFNKELAPECSDYVGPVEIRVTEDGRGRGIFTTRDVNLGELLLVSNPISFVYRAVKDDAEKVDIHANLLVETLRASFSSQRAMRQLKALPHSHDNNSEVPDMSMFKPNMNVVVDHLTSSIDTSKLQSLISLTALALTAPGYMEDPFWAGVWGLPGLVNHSCLPNVSRTNIGRVTFVRATRNISAGNEIVWSYVEPLMLHRKERCFECWGFYCSCRRCIAEEKVRAKWFKDISFDREFSAANEMEYIKQVAEFLTEVEKRIRMIERSITQEETNWIRLGLIDFYVDCATNRTCMQKLGLHDLPSADSIMEMVHSVAPGSLKTMFVMCKLFSFRSLEHEEKSVQLLWEEFKACYGVQRVDAFTEVIKMYKERPLGSFLH